MIQNTTKTIILLFFTLVFFVVPVAADPLSVVDSRDWVDIYSVLLRSNLDTEQSIFVNSGAISGVTRQIPSDAEVTLYTGATQYIPSINTQLEAAGVNLEEEVSSDSLNIDLAREDRFLLVARDNFRTALSIASFAKENNMWVFIVDEVSVDAISASLGDAQEVIAVGEFRRDLWTEIESFVTERVNEGNIFADNINIANRLSNKNNVVLADGLVLEAEFFTTSNPVLLSGKNRLPEETFSFLADNNVRSVILVGNELSVVGEQIRERSDRSISVFIKFGQSAVGRDQGIYSLTVFPMPQLTITLDVQQVLYDPASEELVVYFENTGNSALYMLSTISVKTGLSERELGSVSDEEAIFLGAGEVLPVSYSVGIPGSEFDNSTFAEFFTSYGSAPNSLDTFLTMEDLYSPPFRMSVEVSDFGESLEALEIVDAAYFTGMNRVGVTLNNPNEDTVHVRVQVNDMIVNGLEESIFRNGVLTGLSEDIIYLPLELDKIDLEENNLFDIEVSYGSNEDLLIKKVSTTLPFRTEGGVINLLTGMVVGVTQSTGAMALILLLLVLVAAYVYAKKRSK